jgi:hypothetical protein
MGRKLRIAWYAVISILPIYGATNHMQGTTALDGFIAGAILAAVLYGLTKLVIFVAANLKKSN